MKFCFKRIIIFIPFCFGLVFSGSSQERTVGILQAESDAYLRYQLIMSVDQPYAALIDMCGAVINEWELDNAGLTAHLLNDGNLLVGGRVNDGSYNRPGKSGLLQMRSWDNELLWETQFTDGPFAAHHDTEVLPNGNILVTLWERIMRDDAIAAGRDTSLLEEEMWPDAIFEITPVGTDTFDIAWEWHLWDHLIQDRDTNKANFGIIDEHPERFDLNYETRFNDDWNHVNGLDYNADRDEIIISGHDWSEFYVIDHSTTTDEAAGSTGGNAGKGGDILYRWGNPSTYGRGTAGDFQINAQHDVSYDQPRSSEDTLVFTVFSNNNDISNFSEIVDVRVPLSESGDYMMTDNFQPFGPDSSYFTFDGNPSGAFDSPFMGSYDVLPNGNRLATSSILGEYFEYNDKNELVWHYKVPIGLFGIMPQGDTINGRVFKAYPIELDDPRLEGRDLTPIKSAIEINPLAFDCPYNILSDLDDLPTLNSNLSELVYLNTQTIEIRFRQRGKKTVQMIDMNGRIRSSDIIDNESSLFRLSDLESGLYAIRIVHNDHQEVELFKVVVAQ